MSRKVRLKNAGCELIELYNSNFQNNNSYGYTFIKNNNRYDLRHWLVKDLLDVDFFELIKSKGEKVIFETFEDAVEYIEKEL